MNRGTVSRSKEETAGKSYLRELARLFPSADVVLGRIALLKGRLTLPKGTVHVVSDVHGEYKKLKHVINNASGSLRLLVEQTLGAEISPEQTLQLLNFIHYPHESFNLFFQKKKRPEERRQFLMHVVSLELKLIGTLRTRSTIAEMEAVFPPPYRELFKELISQQELSGNPKFLTSILDQFVTHAKEEDLLRLLARVVRNILVSELIVAGDLGDRGERIDRVVEYLMRQPDTTITWGNHDVSWMGACLGDPTCIATVLRFSLRYSRTEQLEEGYGISLAPLELLARGIYGEDPAERFACKGESWRDARLMARMQKAISIILFKLEAETIRRNPQFEMGERALLHKIDLAKGTVNIEGSAVPLLDIHWPTLSPDDPYRLSDEELACMQRLRESFVESAMLWRHMHYVARNGCMYLRRDQNLIFHACVPCNPEGEFLSLQIDGANYRGRELFEVLNRTVQRAFREKRQSDLDLLWYLWCGSRSPLFGKEKMTAFEGHFIADKELQRERNNCYFELIHQADFCEKILREFGVDPDQGLVVNGHIPVKIDQGESPMKRSGKAVTIDGAFSESYGDRGYTLILDASKTVLAQHHHFESVTSSITEGADIIPTIQEIRSYAAPRTIADTEVGEEIRAEIELLEELFYAYRDNSIREVK